ncbi:MAG TPA: carbohydrate kinase family protein [Terriglobales bacterium]|nr:carbohydrate kinase family protein [Terriglobales bacterium]
MIEVCVVGELNLDLILYGLPKDLELDREHLASGLSLTLGSSSAIFAHNLCALGTQVGFVSKIGADPLGKIAAERLSAVGVDVSRMKQGASKTPTGLTVVLPHPRHRYILTYPGTMFEMQSSDIDMEYVCRARHFHLSSFFLHRALRPRIPDLFRQAKNAGLTTSLDTNDDPENKWGRDLIEVLKHVDIFFPNDREAKKIAHTEDLSQALNFLAGLCKIVVVKRGSSAAICRSGEEQWSLAPPAVRAVDDIGAGDSFDAGFVHLYLLGAKLEDCLAYANIAAAYSVTKEGGTEAFRDRSGLLNFIRQQWNLTGRGPLPGTVSQ